jgi:hypothetical protein
MTNFVNNLRKKIESEKITYTESSRFSDWNSWHWVIQASSSTSENAVMRAPESVHIIHKNNGEAGGAVKYCAREGLCTALGRHQMRPFRSATKSTAEETRLTCLAEIMTSVTPNNLLFFLPVQTSQHSRLELTFHKMTIKNQAFSCSVPVNPVAGCYNV